MRSGLPRVVACMPVWNAEAFIEGTLQSLAAQTYPNLAVVISDDASSDRTAAICERTAAGNPRFRVVRQPTRLGWIGNANFLLGQARGDYAFFAFHDDPVEPAYVSRLVEALERSPHAVLAFTDIYSRDRVDSYRALEEISDRVERARRIIRKQGPWWIPNRGLFRVEAARRIGGMRRHLAGEYKADWPWLLHLALLGEFIRVPEPLIRKIWREESLSASWNRELTLWQSTGVVLSCAREVRQATGGLDAIRLHGELARVWCGQMLRSRHR